MQREREKEIEEEINREKVTEKQRKIDIERRRLRTGLNIPLPLCQSV